MAAGIRSQWGTVAQHVKGGGPETISNLIYYQYAT